MTLFTAATTLNLQNAAQQLAAGFAAIDAGQTDVSFEQTTNVDSSAVGCMLAWQRHAHQRGISLKFVNVPDNLTKLMSLYGVTEFL